MLELMATCRISTAMHHSQREKLPERGGKQPPPRASPNPGARCGAEPATARPGAHRLPSPQPCPATRWGRLLALGQTASSVKVCPQEHSASLWDVQHCSRVLSIPLGCPISLQDAQSPSGMLDIPPGCSASLWDARHPSRVVSIPLDQTVPLHPTLLQGTVSTRVCIHAAPPFLPLLSRGLIFISLSIYFFYLFLAVEYPKSVDSH